MEASQEGTTTIARGRALPLNTRRLTKALFQALAQGLDFLPQLAAGELRLIIEGKLWEMSKDAMSVQVMCNEAEPPQYLLNDDSGVFLSINHY